jgi:hypothetical protein
MNDLQFVVRYQGLPIRCSGRLISLHNEHSLYIYIYSFTIISFTHVPNYYALLEDLMLIPKATDLSIAH